MQFDDTPLLEKDDAQIDAAESYQLTDEIYTDDEWPTKGLQVGPTGHHMAQWCILRSGMDTSPLIDCV